MNSAFDRLNICPECGFNQFYIDYRAQNERKEHTRNNAHIIQRHLRLHNRIKSLLMNIFVFSEECMNSKSIFLLTGKNRN